jgi:glycyl-tRNA synthetase
VKLVDEVAKHLNLDNEETATAKRAAELSKADLATNMVVEITALQGVMGQQYALKSGEKEEVAEAIFEHYLPRFTGDQLPRKKPGVVVGIADTLDSLSGLFAVGLAPTGNKDPFALRRTALRLIIILGSNNIDFDIRLGLEAARKHLPVKASDKRQLECFEFIKERLRNMYRQHHYYDVIDAVLEAQAHNPTGVLNAIMQLGKWVKKKDWHEILPEYSRCVRITRDQAKTFKVDPKLFSEDAEKALYKALETAEAKNRASGSVDDFLNAFEPMIPAVKKFFDDVLVMVEDKKVKENRLGLLQRIAGLADGVADMSRLEGF